MSYSRNVPWRIVWLAAPLFMVSSVCLAASKLIISPANPRQLSHTTLSFTASINGNVVHGPVAWSSSSPAIASIAGSNGSAQASLLGAGTTAITAVHGGQSTSTLLTVTVAVAPVFASQPTDTDVSAVINAAGGVQAQLLDNLGDPLPGQNIMLSIGTNAADGGGAAQNAQGTLTGTLTRSTDGSGVATFSDLAIDWLGDGYTLVASANPSSGPVSATSAAFNELRVGEACLGPQPACSSDCADSDHDGLNDAWEVAGGVDLNGDGVITDSDHDVLLPGSDPDRPDIYLKYDYMATATHDHKPPDSAWEQMKTMFAYRGIALHVLAPASGIPEHVVTTLDPDAQASCAGNDFITMQQLRAQYFGNLRPAYHYMVFAHDSATPHDGLLAGGCNPDAICGARPSAGGTGLSEVLGNDSIVSFGAYVDSNTQVGIEILTSTMMHELGHNFGLVHGSSADVGGSCSTFADCNAGFECLGGRCMNRGQVCLVKKPNYISVMNYTYQTGGLVPNGTPGVPIHGISCTTDADCGPPNITTGKCATHPCFCTNDGDQGKNFCYRPDYAEDNLINLNETTLDENVGVGGPPDDDDIVSYWHDGNASPGPSNGSPIDWDLNEMIQNLSTCVHALPVGNGPTGNCPDVDDNGTNGDQLDTTADWTQVDGQFIHFNFQFQCMPGYQNDVPAPSRSSLQRQVIKVPSGMPTEMIIQQ